MIKLENYIDKYVRLAHQYMVRAACPAEFLHLYISEYCSQITPSAGPFCSTRGPSFGIKVTKAVSRLIPVAILLTFFKFGSPGPNVCNLCTRVSTYNH